MTQTLYDKLMNAHIVREEESTALIYIDRQLIHEVTSPQAFEGLAIAGRKPWRIQANLAVPDHNVPTTERSNGVNSITDPISKLQVETLDKNCIKCYIFSANHVVKRASNFNFEIFGFRLPQTTCG
jgi:3-isopropylmalate/(R)-2-methylmalate dehydratase large subunit